MSRANSGNSAASTDDAGASSSQDATGPNIRGDRSRDGGRRASSKAKKAARVVKPAKIRVPNYSQAIPAYSRAGTLPERTLLEYPPVGFVLLTYPYPDRG